MCPAAAAVRRPPAWACVWLHVYKLSKQNRTPALPAAGCAAAALVSGRCPGYGPGAIQRFVYLPRVQCGKPLPSIYCPMAVEIRVACSGERRTSGSASVVRFPGRDLWG